MDPNGIWIGNQTRTFKLDTDSGAEDYIRGTSNSLDANLEHKGPETQSGHKVDGSMTPTTNTAATGDPSITSPDTDVGPGDELSVDLTAIMDSNGVTNIAANATYNWQRFSADGTTLDTDGIGWEETYTTTDDDAGKTIKVQVYFTDDDGHSEGPRTSDGKFVMGPVPHTGATHHRRRQLTSSASPPSCTSTSAPSPTATAPRTSTTMRPTPGSATKPRRDHPGGREHRHRRRLYPHRRRRRQDHPRPRHLRGRPRLHRDTWPAPRDHGNHRRGHLRRADSHRRHADLGCVTGLSQSVTSDTFGSQFRHYLYTPPFFSPGSSRTRRALHTEYWVVAIRRHRVYETGRDWLRSTRLL